LSSYRNASLAETGRKKQLAHRGTSAVFFHDAWAGPDCSE
jgi:hypothetical protein